MHPSRAIAGFLLALGLGSCKAERAEPAPTPPPNEAKPPAAPAEPEAVAETEELRELMKDHFGQASQARDAVVRGRMEQAEGALVWLGQHAAAKGMPESWRPGVERMQQTARAATDANTLAAAGRAVGLIAAECGACHTAQKRGPEFEPTDFNDLRSPGRGAELRERMHEQLWAIERLWEGLVGPWDGAWRAGCESLSELRGHPRVPAVQRARLEHVRALGSACTSAAGGTDRARVYGDILAECGDCHARSGVVPGAAQTVRH